MSYIEQIQIEGVNHDLHDSRLGNGNNDYSVTFDTPATWENTAGAKGWCFAEWVDADSTTHTLTLVDSEGNPADISLFSVNDILSAKAGFSANYAFKIDEILNVPGKCSMVVKNTGNAPTPTADPPAVGSFDPLNHLWDSAEPGYVWMPDNPGIGTVPIGTGAMAIGIINNANEQGSFSIGAGNNVDGRYAFANGERNKVGYGSVAIGHDNTVYSYDGLVAGARNETKGSRGSAIGCGNKMYANSGLATGVGNEATTGAKSGINIRGTYAITQTTDTFIDVVGNGTSDSNRSNALAVGFSTGSLRVKGDIFVKCNADSSDGINLREEINKKEDKGSYASVATRTISSDTTGDYEISITGKKCVLVWISFPRSVSENFRIFANETNNQNGSQIAVTAGTTGTCNAKIKFDCSHGLLETEFMRQEGIGGFVAKSTYVGFDNEPVSITSVSKIIIRNISNDVLRAGTRIKIYGY